MSLDTALRPPLLTSDLPGIGGRLKVELDDFEVEEIPAYVPSGQGDFLYLWLEKRDMGAEYFARQIARRLEIGTEEVGLAGLKERRAVTRQWVSVPASAEPKLPRLDGEGMRLLEVGRHSNKLRTGHLHGNRFRILVRDASADDAALAAIVDRLREHGLPNYYGPQRFGKGNETLDMGLALLRGERPERPIRSSFLRRLALSAVQSALFNAYLARRLADGLARRVLAGDVMGKLPAGGMFVAEDLTEEQRRFDARETMIAGPIFGRKTFAAQGVAAERESEVLATLSLTATSFNGFGKLLQGTRRHNLVYVADLNATREPAGVRFAFTLPSGSYATVLLREIMKVELDSDQEPAE
jgi:tRNA pseudouridine13 synthase